MSQDGVEETGGEDDPGTEQTEDKDDEEKLEREKTLLNLKKQKRIRKTEMTKIRHHMEKFCITPKDLPKDVDAIEKDIEQLWSLLEITLEILDELCVVYLKNGEEANKQAAMVFTPATDVRGATGLRFRPYPLSAIYLATWGYREEV